MAYFKLHPRLFIAAGVGAVIGVVLPESWGSLVRVVFSWDAAATLYNVLAWIMMLRGTEATIRYKASLQDESGWTLLMISAAAALISLCAIVGLLGGKDIPDPEKTLRLVLAIYTIINSWFFLHTLFTLHYAHEHYGAGQGDKGKTRGGLQFPGTDPTPGYVDFAYYSFTIGMTAQTSDTAVTTTSMRGLTLAHGILTFFFNTVILALSINIAASLL
jgi:uncharacterized membrane protein